MDSQQLQAWLEERRQIDDALYERFGRPLEAAHSGEFVAIADDGRTILGDEELAVAVKAKAEFGPGAFALRKIGARSEVTVRKSAE